MENTGIDYNGQVITKVLPKASKIALIGMGIVCLGSISSMIAGFLYNSKLNEVFKNSIGQSLQQNTGAAIVGYIIGIAILASIILLAVNLKKAKTKAIAINLIVVASIFLVLGIFSFVGGFFGAGFIEANLKTAKVGSSEIAEILRLFTTLNLVAIIGMTGWATVLVGGIFGVRATEAELEENRLAD